MAEPWLALDLQLALGPRALTARLAASGPAAGIVGPSGSGKTTLLRIIAGLERRGSGTVAALGEPWSGPGVFVPPWRRGAAWVPQEAALFPHLTVAENLGYAGAPGAEIAEIAGVLGVSALLARAPRRLSGGERQRVALGRALLARPRLLLLDEPFAALDRPLRERLSRDVAALCRGRGLPVVLVTHDERDLEAFEAQIWSFEGGELRPL